jgi:uncharacterized protein with ParB-like and HNH nuclease domain
MSFQTPITIEEAVRNVHQKKYLLPAIQREVVWDTDQIVKLFDSLMRDYPIGSFLFWYVDKRRTNTFQFYEFVRDYHERDNKHNPKANLSGEDDITGILDGQQRLTALYLGLKGSYSYKEERKRWNNDAAFPKRRLYVNLLSKCNDEQQGLLYDFRFLTDEEADERDSPTFWFRVGQILDIRSEAKVNEYLIKNDLLNSGEASLFANETLFKLHSVIFKNLTINYFLEKDEQLDKVLNIFIRVNSGGTILSYSDLLLSIATAQWKTKDAREVITAFVDEISSIGDGFNLDKDFVLKSCLVLTDIGEIAFKVDSFNKQNMRKIEERWDEVTDAIRLSIELVASLGYNRDTLTSANALIPIAYYLLKKGSPHNFVESKQHVEDRKRIQKWLAISLLKRMFSGQPDNILRPLRKVIGTAKNSFPVEEIVEEFRGKPKSFVFNPDEIENLFEYQYGKAYTFTALALLYPSLDFRNKFHVDHIHPKSFFTTKKLNKMRIPETKCPFYVDNFNKLANLQLLEGTPNQEKNDSDFKKWLFKTYPDDQDRRSFMGKNFIPSIDLGFDNFEEFIKARRRKMKEVYSQLLIKDSQ